MQVQNLCSTQCGGHWLRNELVAFLADFTLHPIDYVLSEEVDR